MQKQREVPTTYSKKVKNRFHLNLKHLNFEVMVSSSTSNLFGTNSISNTTKFNKCNIISFQQKKTNLGRC